MKPQISPIYGVYNTDDRGYSDGDALAYYPIRAAAEARLTSGYMTVKNEECVKFEDVTYLLDKELSKAKIIGKIPAFTPSIIYQNYLSNNYHNDVSEYYCDGKDFLDNIKLNSHLSVYKKIMICDTENNFYLLKRSDTITVEKLVMSRELAVKHALSKLTDEEKKLLGL